ncbi:MAG TPA: efflux transporter outer membrane subunit [Verrucomicrobiota bacterium]|nr:efflux transporter outer membrane subunit [Verrucomicrobiota bacterium]HNU52097.1 efflux transporter outer membrane subunit [Verrucomicrobiota bacterium]
MNSCTHLLLVGTVLLFTSCTLAPKYARPPAPVPAQWPQGAAYPKAAAAPETQPAPDLAWREFFTDEKLRQLIGTALDHNRDLRLATLNVEMARAMYGIQRANLLPAVQGVASAARQRLPADLSNGGRRKTTERYDVNLGLASWEIDFFGRIRSAKDRALQEFLATDQARRGAQILLVSAVANAYLALAADRENLRLSETTLEAQQNTYDLVKRRHELGLVTDIDLYRAQTPLDIARRDVALYHQQIAQDENALQLLAGSPVPDELLPAELSQVKPTLPIAPGLPSDVLLRRPDVLEAESLLKAANADIGAARATFFPRISLTAAVGTASSDLAGLFQSGSGAWSFAPQLVMPIFDARTWSALKASKVQQQMAVTQYEKAIQTAFREVADVLALRGTVDREISAQESLVHALTETHRLARSRYDKGIDSYLGVLDAQRSLFPAQQGLVFLRLSKLANEVRLYAVLGGGQETTEDLCKN